MNALNILLHYTSDFGLLEKKNVFLGLQFRGDKLKNIKLPDNKILMK